MRSLPLCSLIFFALLLFAFVSKADLPSSFTDYRDGNTYGLILVGDDVWLKEDLKYRSPKVHVHIRKKEGDTLFLYGLDERDEVCPSPFHLMRKDELDRALSALYGLSNEGIDTLSWSDPLLFQYHDADSLFSSRSGLYLKKKAWVQGKRYRKKASSNTIHLWVDHNNDNRYHMHMADTNAFVHAHDHHVMEAARKQRKFSVRCVCEKDKLSKELN